MSPAVIQLIFQLIAQLVTEAPALISDIEKLLTAAKGQAPATPPAPVNADGEMAGNLAALEAPIPAPPAVPAVK